MTHATDIDYRTWALRSLEGAAREAAYFLARHRRSRAHAHDLKAAVNYLAECDMRAIRYGCSQAERDAAKVAGKQAGLVEATGVAA